MCCSRAIAAAERCLQIKPNHCELYLDAAVLYYLDGDYEASWNHFELVYSCVEPWLETLGDPPNGASRPDAIDWTDLARDEYMRLEGVDPCSQLSDSDSEGFEFSDGDDDDADYLLDRPLVRCWFMFCS